MEAQRDRKRAIAAISLDALGALLRLPGGIHIDAIFQDDMDRARGIMRCVLSGPNLPDEAAVEEGQYPKMAEFICSEKPEQIPDWECQVNILTEPEE